MRALVHKWVVGRYRMLLSEGASSPISFNPYRISFSNILQGQVTKCISSLCSKSTKCFPLTAAVHLLDILFRFTYKLSQKVLRNGSHPISHPPPRCLIALGRVASSPYRSCPLIGSFFKSPQWVLRSDIESLLTLRLVKDWVGRHIKEKHPYRVLFLLCFFHYIF